MFHTTQEFYGSLFLLSGLILFGIAVWSARTLNEKGAIPFIGLNLGGGGWAFFSGVKVLASTLTWKLVYLKLASISLSVLPLTWMIFALQYTNNEEKWRWPLKTFLWGGAIVFPVLFLTQHWHGAYWESLELATPPETPFPILHWEEGPLYWLHYTFSYVGASAAYLYIGRLGLSSGKLHRRQLVVFLLAIFISTVSNLLSKTPLIPIPYLDMTPIGLGIYGLLITFVFYRHKLFNVTPVARERVLSNLKDALIVLDAKGRVTDWNAAAEPLLRDNPGGEPARTALPEQLLNSLHEAVLSDTNIRNSGASTFSTEQRDLDHEEVSHNVPLQVNGEERMFNAEISMFSTGSAILLRDITELHEKQQELERQNERLDNFAGILAHDLRNPLSVAGGYLDMAQETGNNDPLEKVEHAHTRMEDLIEDVLTLAREGREINETECVALDDLATTAWENVETHAAELTVETSKTVEADRSRLVTLFENLFRNSVEHGGSTVGVTVGEFDGGFYVADTGPGIADEVADNVFSDGFTTNEQGTGFGLSIVQEIVEAHGWEITLNTEARTGARFDIYSTNTESATHD